MSRSGRATHSNQSFSIASAKYSLRVRDACAYYSVPELSDGTRCTQGEGTLGQRSRNVRARKSKGIFEIQTRRPLDSCAAALAAGALMPASPSCARSEVASCRAVWGEAFGQACSSVSRRRCRTTAPPPFYDADESRTPRILFRRETSRILPAALLCQVIEYDGSGWVSQWRGRPTKLFIYMLVSSSQLPS